MIKIKEAEAIDVNDILKLQKISYKSEAKIYHDESIPPLTQTLEEIKKEYERIFFLKAVIKNKIIGSVRAFTNEGTCYIGRLIVHPGNQNQGVGTALMRTIESHFNASERFELFTGKKSKKNISFYQKLGYKVFKELEVNSRLTLIYLEKENSIF